MASTAIVVILCHQITVFFLIRLYQLTSHLICTYEYLGRAEEERSPMVYIHLEYWVVIAPAMLTDSTNTVGFTAGPLFAVVRIIYIIYSKVLEEYQDTAHLLKCCRLCQSQICVQRSLLSSGDSPSSSCCRTFASILDGAAQ